MKWDVGQIKAQVGMRMRWIGIGTLVMLVALFVLYNFTEQTIDLVVAGPFAAPGFVLFTGLFVGGLILGIVVRFLSAKWRIFEGRYHQRLKQESAFPPPPPFSPAQQPPAPPPAASGA